MSTANTPPCPYHDALEIALSGCCLRAVEVMAWLRMAGHDLDSAMRAASALVRAGVLAH